MKKEGAGPIRGTTAEVGGQRTAGEQSDMQTTVARPEISVLGAPGHLLKTPREVAALIVELSDEQVALKDNAFNWARITLRLEQDFGINRNEDEFIREIVHCLCDARKHDINDFHLAMEATQHRPRYPYGLNPLEEACDKAKQNPLQLKCPTLSESKLAAIIATIALELQVQQGENPILLPVEHLRRLLRQRKLLVGGAIRALVKHKILSEVDPSYYRRKAREFRFIAKVGLDFDRREAAG